MDCEYCNKINMNQSESDSHYKFIHFNNVLTENGCILINITEVDFIYNLNIY